MVYELGQPTGCQSATMSDSVSAISSCLGTQWELLLVQRCHSHMR